MDNQKKKTMKSRAKQFISFALILAIVICGAFAYLTATDSKKNVFTVGNVDIELIEEKWDENGNYEGELNLNMLPGEEIPKAPYIKNTGDNEAWVYVTVGVPTVYAENAEDITLEATDFNIPVNAYAIQDMYEGETTAKDVWNAYNADENITAGFGTPLENTAGRVEIFKIKTHEALGFNEAKDNQIGWEQIGLYQVNGHNYYVFAYNTKLAAPQSEDDPSAKTTPVFTSVVLNPNINAIGTDVLFHPASTDNIDYFSAEDIGGDVAAEYYGDPNLSAGNFDYEGSIPSDYVPEDGDVYVFGQTAHVATFNSSASAWEITGTVDETISNNAEVPTTLMGSEIKERKPEIGDEVILDGYTYKYGYSFDWFDEEWQLGDYLGWGVRVNDTTLTEYKPMQNTILGEPVTMADTTYANCKNLIVAPILSDNLKSMDNAFNACSAMIEAPEIPNAVENLYQAFMGCSVVDGTFNIPATATNIIRMFSGCKKLTIAPTIPYGITDLEGTFSSCESLTYAPAIPETVVCLNRTFSYCKSLISAPIIPEGVTDMERTFNECPKLDGEILIPSSVTTMKLFFDYMLTTPTGNIVMKYYENCVAASEYVAPKHVTKSPIS